MCLGCSFERLKKVLQLPMILKKSNRKPNKIWIDKGSEFEIVLLKNG